MAKPKRDRRRDVRDLLDKIQVRSMEECEEADYVVCMPKGSWSPFTDNVESTCSVCGCAIFHRPHVPKKPKKICIHCMDLIARTEDQPRQ